jgi:polyhydroxybutyrate depolymerase
MASDAGRGRRRRLLAVAAIAGAVVVLLAITVALVWSSRSSPGDAPSSAHASAAAGTSSAPAGSATAGPFDREVTLQVDGRERSMLVHAPSQSGPLPLVLVFHGAGDTAKGTASATDFERAGDERGFVVAFLQGYQNTWNEGAGHTPAEVAGIDDVAFARAAVGRVERMLSIDREHVAAVGFSNGALMVDLLGCRMADVIRLVVPVAGPLPVSVAKSCAPSAPISVLEVHGTADGSIPYDGGSFAGIGGGTTVLSAPDAVARWASLDGCSGRATSAPSSSGVRMTSYSGCPAGVSVQLRTLVGAGHGWPDDIGELVAGALGR